MQVLGGHDRGIIQNPLDNIDGINEWRFGGRLSRRHDTLFATVERGAALGIRKVHRTFEQGQHGAAIGGHGQIEFGSANGPRRNRRAKLNLRRLFPAEEIRGPGFELELRFAGGFPRRLNLHAGEFIHAHDTQVRPAQRGPAA